MDASYEQGVRDERSGVKLRQNPYRIGSQEWSGWRDGWIDSRDNLAPIPEKN